MPVEGARMSAIAVTGANRGIGAAIATLLLERGATVGCLSRSGTGPEGLAPALASRTVCVPCDVTDEAAVRAALAKVAEQAGGIRGLVNNAGIHREHRAHELTTAEFETMLATNATAVFVCCREAYPHLVANGGGMIVNIGSFFDRIGVKRNVAYCAAKAAVGAITRCLAVEWGGKGVRVVDVAPGYIETDLNREGLAQPAMQAFLAKRVPLGGAGTPQAVAKLVGALLIDDIPFLTGETIYIDGGQGIAH
jgi:NAD(P)-dependent dehydrogenase (short-subunit alcohol dehydrogenase family)